MMHCSISLNLIFCKIQGKLVRIWWCFDLFISRISSSGSSTFGGANLLLPTAREGNVFTGVCQSFCSQLASWLLHNCSSLSRYASYWECFLVWHIFCRNCMKILKNWLRGGAFLEPLDPPLTSNITIKISHFFTFYSLFRPYKNGSHITEYLKWMKCKQYFWQRSYE